jgi:hypothetical protein
MQTFQKTNLFLKLNIKNKYNNRSNLLNIVKKNDKKNITSQDDQNNINIQNIKKLNIENVIIDIIVPFRDRENQWEIFIKHMCIFFQNLENNYIINNNINHNTVNSNDKSSSTNYVSRINIWRIEQTVTDQSFNRAMLFNIGLKVSNNYKYNDDDDNIKKQCVIIHDVDLLPEFGVDYMSCNLPTQLSSEMENFNWGIPYNRFSGGVFTASRKHWIEINGMSNKFWGWGGEDDELFFRWRRMSLLLLDNLPNRPLKGHGRFRKNSINHNRRKTIDEEYNKNVHLMNGMENGKFDPSLDGFNQVNFSNVHPIQRDTQTCNNSLLSIYHVKVNLE